MVQFGRGEETKSGQLGDGTNRNKNIPVQVNTLSDITAIAVGRNHSLALKSDGTVLAWGNNIVGQLGDGSNQSSNEPVEVTGLSNVISIAAESVRVLP